MTLKIPALVGVVLDMAQKIPALAGVDSDITLTKASKVASYFTAFSLFFCYMFPGPFFVGLCLLLNANYNSFTKTAGIHW